MSMLPMNIHSKQGVLTTYGKLASPLPQTKFQSLSFRKGNTKEAHIQSLHNGHNGPNAHFQYQGKAIPISQNEMNHDG